MAVNPMYAQQGLDISQAIAGFVQQGIATKLAGKLQKYRNQMLEVTAAMSQNVVTLNKIETRDATMRLQFALQKQSAEDQGAATVSAAAAGVQGNSVDATMRGLRRSAAGAQAARKARTAGENRAHKQDSRNIDVSLAMNRDITVLAKPSLLSSMVGLGKTLIDTYDKHQPEGDRLLE